MLLHTFSGCQGVGTGAGGLWEGVFTSYPPAGLECLGERREKSLPGRATERKEPDVTAASVVRLLLRLELRMVERLATKHAQSLFDSYGS